VLKEITASMSAAVNQQNRQGCEMGSSIATMCSSVKVEFGNAIKKATVK
jgi:hypothetical protein